MTVQICSCEGLNPKCEKCFGSGYVNSGTKKSASIEAKTKVVVQKKPKYESMLPENLTSLNKKEIENVLVKIMGALDVKSKKQMQLLNAIPFSSTTFRRDFKNKFEGLSTLENSKQFMRSELDLVAKEMAAKKIRNDFKFSHFLSDKEIDVTSNRQLKTLIREYKKLKGKSAS
ncbi:MAG: hypothetical protein EOO50_04855 [Flavobacterium sp.]|uniref:hypothetical protein n=1 Tax=Flavobacterium sp. TaxID=239 RepID=UPI0011FC5839|nr:hypothetical protein [Flavobacterium sp.]RZJ67612.1 MAG: hypothetical protein EOO50_04855 [Flavobacterium sp.]